ncbi:MAG TPA: GAF domain-containing protein [Sphingobacteriaceae bacterium]
MEDHRVRSVQRYLSFELDRQKELNEIVKLASLICETPIALITLMDKDTQWIKAKIGAEVDRMPRETSFCNYAIQKDEVMVVPDALTDPRFANIPTVSQAPFLRFYAGANLKSYEGYNVGTICVYDLKPKDLSAKQQEALSALANQVSHIMELDRTMRLLREQNLKLSEIARIQSHELRKPVASIMGIMGLIKDSGYHPEPEHLQLLQQSVEQLDEKIRLIVKETAP